MESPFSNYIKFSESRYPESFSNAILSINLDTKKGVIKKMLTSLDLKFRQDLQILINGN